MSTGKKWALALSLAGVLVLIGVLFILAFQPIQKYIRKSHALESGVRLTAFETDGEKTIRDFFEVPDGFSLQTLEYRTGFRDSRVVLYTQIHQQTTDAVNDMLLDDYDVLDPPYSLRGFSFQEDPSKCVGQFHSRGDSHHRAFLYDEGDYKVCVFYSNCTGELLDAFVRQNITIDP